MSRPYHHGHLAETLLQAAEIELAAVGPGALSLRAVARRAGTTHAAIYHHYADRGALLAALAARGFGALDAALGEAIAAAGKDPREQLMAAGLAYLAFARAHPQTVALLFEERGFPRDAAVREAGARAFGHLLGVVERVRPGPGALADALVCWSAMHGLAALGRGGGLDWTGLDAAQQAQILTERVARLVG